jgi:hypothetical protein
MHCVFSEVKTWCLGALALTRKAPISFVMSVLMHQLGARWLGVRRIFSLSRIKHTDILQNVEKIRTPPNSGKPTASFMWSRCIVVSTVTRPRTERLGDQLPAGRRNVSLLQNVQTGYGVQSASYSMVTRQKLGADRLLPFSAEVKSEWSCNSTPPGHLHSAYRDNFNFCALSGDVTNQY